MVPKGWSVKQLDSICSKPISYGIVQTGPDVANGIPCIRVVDLSKNDMNISEMITTTDEIHQSYKKTILQGNELVMALRGEIGLVKLVPNHLVGANITRGIARLAPQENIVDSKFFLWAMRSHKVKKDLTRKSGGSALQEISLTALRKVKVPVPPLPEQQKIAKILSTWDKAISTTERLIENSTQQKKALMQQLLTGKKRLLDDEGQRFKGEWARHPISFVADVITGNTPSTKNQEYYGGDKLFVSPSDLGISKYILETTKRLTDLGFNQTRKVPKGSSLFTCIGSTIGKIGIAGEELATNQQINSVCAKGNNCGEFIYYQLLFHAEQIKGSAATQAVPIINKTNFESQLIFSPASLQEQQKIATVLTNADKEIELLEQQLADLQQEKKALMQVLLTGKKRVVVDGQ